MLRTQAVFLDQDSSIGPTLCREGPSPLAPRSAASICKLPSVSDPEFVDLYRNLQATGYAEVRGRIPNNSALRLKRNGEHATAISAKMFVPRTTNALRVDRKKPDETCAPIGKAGKGSRGMDGGGNQSSAVATGGALLCHGLSRICHGFAGQRTI